LNVLGFFAFGDGLLAPALETPGSQDINDATLFVDDLAFLPDGGSESTVVSGLESANTLDVGLVELSAEFPEPLHGGLRVRHSQTVARIGDECL
jgi:hypothetical protein